MYILRDWSYIGPTKEMILVLPESGISPDTRYGMQFNSLPFFFFFSNYISSIFIAFALFCIRVCSLLKTEEEKKTTEGSWGLDRVQYGKTAHELQKKGKRGYN